MNFHSLPGFLRWVVPALIVAACSAAQPQLYLIGDSTMANKPLDLPERGWGMVLPDYFTDPTMIHNYVVNGRSTKSFIEEGRWDAVRARLKRGDFVIIQFGHNDEKKEDPKRFTDPATTFRANLERFVRESRERGAIPILATPVCRRSFDPAGKLLNTHDGYPDAVRAVAENQKVPLLDLERDTAKWLQSVGDADSKQYFMWIAPGKYPKLPEGRQDNTHFVEAGARHVAELAIAEMRGARLPLTEWLR